MSTFPDIAQQVRDRADIVETIRAYVDLRRAGTQWKGLCPFHKEKTPSFHVHPARQGWHCFGCGKGGSVIDFVMGVEKLDFAEALELLARRLGIDMPRRPPRDMARVRAADTKRDAILSLNQWALHWYRANLKAEPHGAVAAYVERRRIAPDRVEVFQLGASPAAWQGLRDAAVAKGFPEDLLVEAGLVIRSEESGRVYDRFRDRFMFPILDHLARCIGFGGRIVAADPDKKQPKYINSSETPVYQKGRSLYGLFQAQDAMQKAGRVLLVEGYLDCIMCHQAGFRETVASLGTALTPDQARLLRRYAKEVVFVYDGDEAGQNAMRRGAEVLVQAGLQARVAVLPPEDDPDTIILREGAEGFARFVEQAVDVYDFFLQAALPPEGEAEIIQRVAAVDAIAPLLLAIENPVERDLRIQSVARQVGVEPSVVQNFLMGRAKRGRGAAAGGRPGTARGGDAAMGVVHAPGRSAEPRAHPDEEDASYSPFASTADTPHPGESAPRLLVPLLELGLLRCAVESDDMLALLRERIDPTWLDPAVAELIRAILAFKGQERFDPVEFYSAWEDERGRQVFAAALFADDLIPPRDERELTEIAVRLQVRHLKQCASEWLAALAQGVLTPAPGQPLPVEQMDYFRQLNREASEAVRRLERRTFVVKPAVRF